MAYRLPAVLRSRLALVADRIEWVRSFGSADGLEAMPALATEFRLKLAMGAWIGDIVPEQTAAFIRKGIERA